MHETRIVYVVLKQQIIEGLLMQCLIQTQILYVVLKTTEKR